MSVSRENFSVRKFLLKPWSYSYRGRYLRTNTLVRRSRFTLWVWVLPPGLHLRTTHVGAKTAIHPALTAWVWVLPPGLHLRTNTVPSIAIWGRK